MISLCNQWEFTRQWSDSFALGEGGGEAVRLPHNVQEMPLHYADHKSYEMLCGYRRKLEIREEWLHKRIFLQFDGAAHIATVYLNGREVGHHRCGYTAFRLDITGQAVAGENLLAVKLDTTENPAVPPFGFVIDYLTYGGLYREAWLDVREQSYIRDIYVTTPALDTLQVQLDAVGTGCSTRIEVLDGEAVLLRHEAATWEKPFTFRCPGAIPWDTENPKRYTCRVSLLSGEGALLDRQQTAFGFRTVEFRADGFFLNGKHLFLRGLNRHQCYPYVGYAAPERLQREDARILKEELGCVIVRTSHYPQSHYFIDECDRLGLLVFTEIPGWQHLGDEAWQEQAVENTREMVLQYRNHPSIILWGVRINESQDCDALYRRTNAVARALDPSRPTSGVRFIKNSSLLEDVYGYNDFSHAGSGSGVEPRRAVTKHGDKALLITEHNGHMFPTKSFDNYSRLQEHAMRHARVQNDAAADGGHVGCIGWCMFDYGTHKDFGSGDRVCYHGVMDTFRNPKPAAAVYASQQDRTPVLALSSNMQLGDYPAASSGDIYVFSNADEVALYKDDAFVTLLPALGWTGLPHPPLLLNDRVGCLLQTEEGYPEAKAELLRRCLQAIVRHGIDHLPAKEKLRLGYAMARYGMTFQDGVALYNKYVSGWGSEATRWRLEARKGGRVVSEAVLYPTEKLQLEVKVSHTALREGSAYDMAAVRVRIVNEYGAPALYAQLPVSFRLEGEAALVGPVVTTAEGGMCGTFVQTVGRGGEALLTVSAPGMAAATVRFTVEVE